MTQRRVYSTPISSLNLEKCGPTLETDHLHNFHTHDCLRTPVTRGTLTLSMSYRPILECVQQRRTAVRYWLRLPVLFYWSDGIEHAGAGFTNNVSLDGALISTSKCPPVGSQIRIEVLIPSPDQSGEELRVECIGTVTRVVEQLGCRVFGVQGRFDDDHITRQVFE
jgi:hypothetical protein